MEIVGVDSDGHVLDNRELVYKHLPESFKKREWWWTPRNTWDTTIEGQFGQPNVNSAEWLDALKKGNVSKTVLFPTRLLNINFVQEPELATALCIAYNTYLKENYLDVCPKFKGIALIPMQDVDQAVRELNRAVSELGMVSAMLPTHGPPVRPMLGDSYYYPIYEEAQKLGVPLCLHATVTNPSGPEVDPFERMIDSHTLIHPFGQMRQLTSIIFRGVFEDFPNLKLGSMEARASWVPFFMERLDEEWNWRGAAEAPKVTSLPSNYFRNGRIYVCCEPDEALLPTVMEFVGEDWFMFASDYPHPDSEFPESLECLRNREDMDDIKKNKIIRENAIRFYGLDQSA